MGAELIRAITGAGLRKLLSAMRGELARRLQPKIISRLAGLVLCLLVGLSSSLWAHTAVQKSASAEWHWRPDVVFALIVFAFIYARGWVRLRNQSGRAAKKSQLTLYLAGLASIGVALLSPVDALASSRLSVHMVQHLLLLMIAPLSILLANPLTPFLWGLPTALRYEIGKMLARGSVFRCLLWAATLLPVTWSLYVVNLWAWHHPALYQAALKNEWVHDLQHLLFFFTAILFWWPIVDPGPRLHGSISYGFRIIYLVAATLQNTLLGFVISFPERVIYPFYATVPALRSLAPVDDQALGGGIMWVSGHMYLIPILVLFARFLQREEAALCGFDPKEG